ncbi:MAG: DUF420 domain-containing protein [Verrucomicrobia bacterium]|jgi:putative membrane protein|nr:DUF420 domain-containing protein [Verrucomicrobiota bacterium]
MNLSDLPAINACLNSLSAVFLALGYWFIRRNNRIAHRNCMVAATITSAVFLVCYLVYHYFAGRTVFQNPPWFRPVYLGILLTHTVLAVAVVPLVLTTLWRAVKTDFKGHRKIARWTWPIWMYVSVTGVVIYLLLYQVFPQS